MPALQVKDFPEELYEELRQCAAEECRSVSQQTVYILRDYLRYREAFEKVKAAQWAFPYVVDLMSENGGAQRRERAERRRRIFERIHGRGPVEVPESCPDAVQLVREMREERTDRIIEACGDQEAAEAGKVRS